MAPLNPFVALSILAILSCFLSALPTNALSLDTQHRRQGHNDIALRKRNLAKRCQNRPTSTTSSFPSSPPPQQQSSTSTSWTSPSTPASSPSSWTPSSSPSTTDSSSYPVWSTSSTSSPSPSPSSGSHAAPGKLGLAWVYGDNPALLGLFISPRIQYLYTWEPAIPSNLLGLTGVPMLWGLNQIAAFDQLVVAGYAHHVLGYNEPNEPTQSNMDPATAAQVWMAHIQPKSLIGYQLITPATTSNPNGIPWMQDFMKNCIGCTFDKLATHFYDTTFEKLQAYLENWHNTFGLDIWLTEFACQNFNGGSQPTDGEIWVFYSQAITWMDATSWIEVYFPFGMFHDMGNVNPADSMFDGNAFTALGWLAINGS